MSLGNICYLKLRRVGCCGLEATRSGSPLPTTNDQVDLARYAVDSIHNEV